MISEKNKANETWREAISETQTLNTLVGRTRSQSKETNSVKEFPTFEEFVKSMASNLDTNSQKIEFEPESQKVIEISAPKKLVSLQKSIKNSQKSSSKKRKTIEIDYSKHKSILEGRDSMLAMGGIA